MFSLSVAAEGVAMAKVAAREPEVTCLSVMCIYLLEVFR